MSCGLVAKTAASATGWPWFGRLLELHLLQSHRLQLDILICPGTAWQWWYGITFSATAVVYPFLTIYFKECGFNDRQIGILFAVRPWLTAIMGKLSNSMAVANWVVEHASMTRMHYTDFLTMPA